MWEGSEWVKCLYKTLSMWLCVAYIRTVTFEPNICFPVFAISSGFICEVVMARTNAFSFQIISSLIDTWSSLTVNLLICFTIGPMNIENTLLLSVLYLYGHFFIPPFSLRSNNWKICPKYTFHQGSSLALNLNRNLKKRLVKRNPKKKLVQAWIPSQEKLTNWWRYFKLHDFATSYVLSILSLASFFFSFFPLCDLVLLIRWTTTRLSAKKLFGLGSVTMSS